MPWKIVLTGLFALGLASCEAPRTKFPPYPYNRYQIVPGNGYGPAAVFEFDTLTKEFGFIYWDPEAKAYRWQRIDRGNDFQGETTEESG